MSEKERVLFLCTGNSCRSQMAEGFLRQLAGDVFEVHSAGLTPSVVHPLAIQVMQEVGVDISGQWSKNVSAYLGQTHFQYLITVCADADRNCPTIWPGVNKRMHWGFDDPAKAIGTQEEVLAAFRTVRDQIQSRIQTWLTEMAIPSK